MLDNGRTDREESHVSDVKIREKRESSIRLKGSLEAQLRLTSVVIEPWSARPVRNWGRPAE